MSKADNISIFLSLGILMTIYFYVYFNLSYVNDIILKLSYKFREICELVGNIAFHFVLCL